MIFNYEYSTSVDKKGEKQIFYLGRKLPLKKKKIIEYGYLVFNILLFLGFLSSSLYYIIKFIIPDKKMDLKLKIAIYVSFAISFFICGLLFVLLSALNVFEIHRIENLPIEIKKVTNNSFEQDEIEKLQNSQIESSKKIFDSDEKQEFFLTLFNFFKFSSDEKNFISSFENIFQLENSIKSKILAEILKTLKSLKDEANQYENNLQKLKNFTISQFIIFEFSRQDAEFLKSFANFFNKEKQLEMTLNLKNDFQYICQIKYQKNKFFTLNENIIQPSNDNLKDFVALTIEFLKQDCQKKLDKKILEKIKNMNLQIDNKFLNYLEAHITHIQNSIIDFRFYEKFVAENFSAQANKLADINSLKKQKIENFSDIFQFSNEDIKESSQNISQELLEKKNLSFLEEKLQVFCQNLKNDNDIDEFRSRYSTNISTKKSEETYENTEKNFLLKSPSFALVELVHFISAKMI